jgi:hypothetical protein
MTAHNRANDTIRAIMRQARVRADRIIDRTNRGVRTLPPYKRSMSPEEQARYDAVKADTKRLGLRLYRRPPQLKGLDVRSRKTSVTLVPITEEIKAANRQRLAAAVAKKAAADTARAMKAEADALYGRGKRHYTG